MKYNNCVTSQVYKKDQSEVTYSRQFAGLIVLMKIKFIS